MCPPCSLQFRPAFWTAEFLASPLPAAFRRIVIYCNTEPPYLFVFSSTALLNHIRRLIIIAF